jgi:hypothetical protein
MKKGDRIEFHGLLVQKVFSGGNGPPTIVVTPPDEYAEMFRHPKYGPQLKIKAWRYTQFPEEGATVDVIGHWDEYKGQWSVSVDAQRDDEGIWSDGGHLADGAAPAPAAAHPSYDRPAQATAPAKPRGGKSLSSVVSEISTIKSAVVNAGLADTPEDLRAYVIHISIMHERNPLDMAAQPDEDIPF